jgi:hypothetical protein
MSLTDHEAVIIRQIYPESLQPGIQQNYLALKAFVYQNHCYPSEVQPDGQKYPPNHPERRLAIFMKMARQMVIGSPSIKQLLELLPNWSWRSS